MSDPEFDPDPETYPIAPEGHVYPGTYPVQRDADTAASKPDRRKQRGAGRSRAGRSDAPESDRSGPEPAADEPVARFDMFRTHLQLEAETARFILVNALDLFVTFLLLYFSNRGYFGRAGVYESNPIAQFFVSRWGTRGLVFFKFAVIALVVVIAQVVAREKPKTAKWLLNLGALFVGGVVVYSLLIMVRLWT